MVQAQIEPETVSVGRPALEGYLRVPEAPIGCCQTNANQSRQGQDGCPLFSTETAPLGESGGAVRRAVSGFLMQTSARTDVTCSPEKSAV